MEKQYYTVREIILGLREEYIKNQKQLEALSKCFDIRSSEVESFNLEIGNVEEKEIIAHLSKRGNFLQRILCSLFEDYVVEEQECIYNNEQGLRTRNLKLSRDNIIEFRNLRKQIFSNPFLEKMKLSPISLTGKEYDIGLWIDQKGIKLYKTRMMLLETMLEYSAKTDKLISKSGSSYVSSSNLSQLLETEIPTMIFKNYHKDAIVANSNKEIFLQSFAPCTNATFTFSENQRGIVLVKTN